MQEIHHDVPDEEHENSSCWDCEMWQHQVHQAEEEEESRLFADSCCNNVVLGSGWVILEKGLNTISMSGFEDSMDMPTAAGATAVQLPDGNHVTLVANNAACPGCGDSIVSNPQVEQSGHLMNDRPFPETPEMVLHPGTKNEQVIPLETFNGACAARIVKPTKEMLDESDACLLTNENPWDPETETHGVALHSTRLAMAMRSQDRAHIKMRNQHKIDELIGSLGVDEDTVFAALQPMNHVGKTSSRDPMRRHHCNERA